MKRVNSTDQQKCINLFVSLLYELGVQSVKESDMIDQLSTDILSYKECIEII